MGFLSLYDGYAIIDAATGKEVESEKDAEWWVRVVRNLPKIDHDATQRALMGDKGISMSSDEAGNAQGNAALDTVGFQSELVARALVAWNLTDRADQQLPLGVLTDELSEVARDAQVAITKASVAKLPGAVFASLFQTLNKLTGGPREPAEEAQFRVAGDGRDPQRDGGATDPQPVRA